MGNGGTRRAATINFNQQSVICYFEEVLQSKNITFDDLWIDLENIYKKLPKNVQTTKI